MGCGCGSKKVNNSAVSQQPVVNAVQQQQQQVQEQCTITLDILNRWEGILNCVKNNGVYQKVGVSEIVVNQFLGIIQSAKNYPVDYCYYKANLESFKNDILPKIIENEPNCI